MLLSVAAVNQHDDAIGQNSESKPPQLDHPAGQLFVCGPSNRRQTPTIYTARPQSANRPVVTCIAITTGWVLAAGDRTAHASNDQPEVISDLVSIDRRHSSL